MEKGGYGAQQSGRIIKLAQYLARLTAQQNVWIEAGKALVTFLDADLVAFGERGPGGEIRVRDWSFSAHMPRQTDLELLIDEAVIEVLDSGFLTWRIMCIPEPLSVACLPVVQEHQITAVMLAGYRISESSLKALLDIHLAVADLVGTTIARLASERELRQYRQHLEKLVKERTAELIETNEKLQQEIIHREQAEKGLLAEKDNLMRILGAMEDVIYIVSPNFDIEYANPAFVKEFPNYEGRKCYELIHAHKQACSWCQTQAVLRGKTGRSEQYCVKNKKTYDVIETPIRNTDDSLSVLTIFRDITERKRAEEIIKEMAYHDALTRLPNRSLFDDRLKLEIARARRHRQKLALMMLDLDRFKQVNDIFGHDVGDQLLRAVSKCLVGVVRESDTVARLGGDEFVLILPEIAKTQDAIKIAEKIIAGFQNPFAVCNHTLRVTTSVGIALYPDDGEERDVLMKKADIAMYHAKQSGRNCYQVHAPIPCSEQIQD